MSMQAAEKLLTADEFLALPNPEGRPRDLIDGKVVDMSWPGGRHGKLVNFIATEMTLWARQNGGQVLVDAGFVLDASRRTVRAPDIAFLPGDLASHADSPRHIDVPPSLAVEVLSPNDPMSQTLEKVRWLLQHGTRQVWVVDDTSRTVSVYLSDATARVYRAEETVDAGDALPGFRFALAEMFA